MTVFAELLISVPDYVLELIEQKRILRAEAERIDGSDPDRLVSVWRQINGITQELAAFVEFRVSQAEKDHA